MLSLEQELNFSQHLSWLGVFNFLLAGKDSQINLPHNPSVVQRILGHDLDPGVRPDLVLALGELRECPNNPSSTKTKTKFLNCPLGRKVGQEDGNLRRQHLR